MPRIVTTTGHRLRGRRGRREWFPRTAQELYV